MTKRKSEHLRKQSLMNKRQRGYRGQVIKCMPQNHEQENKEDNKENSPPLSSNEQLQIEKENGDKGNSPPLSFNDQNLSLELENYYLALKDLNLIRSKAILEHVMEKGINFIDSLSFDLVRQYCSTLYAIWTQILCLNKPHKLEDLR